MSSALAILALLLATNPPSTRDLPQLSRDLKQAREEGNSEREVATLQEIALLGVDDPKGGKAHCKLIASSLENGQPEAQLEAARLLGLAIHRESSIDFLVDALKEAGKDFARHKKEMDRGNPNTQITVNNGVQRPGGELGELWKLTEALIEAMGKIRANEHRDALGKFLKQDAVPGEVQALVIETLLKYGDRKSFEIVRDWMARIDKQRPKNESTEHKPAGGSVTISSSSGRGEHYASLCPPATRAHLHSVRLSLIDLAQQQQLPSPPAPENEARLWKAWVDQIIPRLPKSLDESSSPSRHEAAERVQAREAPAA